MRVTTFLSTLLVAAATLATAAELEIDVTHPVECTRKTTNGDDVKMHYRGTLAESGKQFDASYDRGSPLSFKLGTGRVIKGYVPAIPPFLLLFVFFRAMEKEREAKKANWLDMFVLDGIKDYWTCV